MKKKTRYVLLGLLHGEQLTGYEMKKMIDGQMGFFWQESYGQIYPELSLLRKEGLIQEAEADKKASGRESTRYAITQAGQAELKRWMEAENEKETVRNELLLKMYLSTRSNLPEMTRHLKKFNEQSKAQLELFRLFEGQLTQTIDLHANHRSILDVLSLGILQQELYCKWSDELLEKFTLGEGEQ